MSKDIRSFFTVISKKSATDSQKPNFSKLSLSKKKPKKVIDSDDEDIISPTPENKSPKKYVKRPVGVLSSDSEDGGAKHKAKTSKKCESKAIAEKRPIEVLSSDSDDEKNKPKKSDSKSRQLKPVKVDDIFKKVPVRQSKVEYTPKSKPEKKTKDSKKKKVLNTELGIHNNVSFEDTLRALDDDDDIFEQNLDILEQSALQMNENDGKPRNEQKNDKKEVEPTKNKKESVSNKEKTEVNKNKENEPKTGERKRSRTDSSSDSKNTPKKKKIEHTDSGIDPGQEAHEKRRYSAMLYQKYLNRSGPKHHGMKEIPKGKPDCLNNLTFLRTGVLDSLESEEFDNLIKIHGGRTVHSVSKKVNYIIVGEEPGPAKLAKAESLNIKTLNEDELLDLILVKSGMEPKYCKKDTSISSEDLGIGVDSKETSPETRKPEKDLKNINTKSPKKINNEGNKTHSSASKVPETLKPDIKTKPSTNKTYTSEIKVQQTENLNLEIESKPNISKPQTSEIILDDESEREQLLSLTDKYKPTELRGIIGQQDKNSVMNRLRNWLIDWHKNQEPKNKKNITRPNPWKSHSDNGAYFKCALLSGSPGVGKTTTATLVAKDLGLDIVEFNASDTRSKRLLHEEVSQLLSSKSLAGFATGKSNVSKNRVLLMDEVDGMAGNEDRGGIQELIQLIKNSSVPIICMCNDRNHQKIRFLANYCYDLRFTKARPEQIMGAMMTVCFREKINISSPALKEIIIGTGCDIRQVFNHLSMLAISGKEYSVEEAKTEANKAKKDTVMGPWEVVRTVFTENQHKDMSLADKARLFFYDYSLGPLFVQENYLRVMPSSAKNNKKKTLLKIALAADSISKGDLVDAKIRSNNNWALLESQAFFSSVIPGYYMSGQFSNQINFPAWLGKNSKKNKYNRIISELHTHTITRTLASKMAMRLDYMVHLKNFILRPLVKEGMSGVDLAVIRMKNYTLLREDFDNLVEICQSKCGPNPIKLDSKVKSAFTRTYNKRLLLPFTPGAGLTKKKASTADTAMYGEEDDYEESDNESEDDIKNNAMIKVKKAIVKGKKASNEAETSKANESKAKTTENKRGKGKKK